MGGRRSSTSVLPRTEDVGEMSANRQALDPIPVSFSQFLVLVAVLSPPIWPFMAPPWVLSARKHNWPEVVRGGNGASPLRNARTQKSTGRGDGPSIVSAGLRSL